MRRALAGVVVLGLLVGAWGAWSLTRSETHTYTITADVEQAPNLFAGGRVMVRGVDVGTITAVEPNDDAVHLTMEIEDDVKVPADARLTVVPITVIADRYVQLYPAYKSGPALRDGDHLSLDRTTIPAELEDVLAQVKGLLKAIEPKRNGHGPLAKLVTSLDEAVAGHGRDIAGTLDQGATVLENLANSDADIAGLVRNLDRLFAALANRSSQIGLLNERFALVAETLANDQRDVEGTIENLTFLSTQAAGLVEESGDDLGVSFRRLHRVLDLVLSHEASLTRGIKWTNVVAQALGETDASGRGRWAYSGRQAPPGSPRAAYNYRIDSRDTVGCERLRIVAASVLDVNPVATLEDLTSTVLAFTPDAYDDDLEFLVKQLIPLCTDLNQATLGDRASAVVHRTVDRIGEKRFLRLLGRWFLAGYEKGGDR
ncbi:MAG TPA: MCE family protein [Actinomycetota bacterium]|nr:MCE family protein [Actinomycetota bacterium]